MIFATGPCISWPFFVSPFEELFLVDCCPLDHEPHHARRQVAREGGQIADVDQRQVAAVLRMEMGWIVIIKEHLDDNAEEATGLRHK